MLGLLIDVVRRIIASNMKIRERFANAWNAFRYENSQNGYVTESEPYSVMTTNRNTNIVKGSVANMAYTKIAIDVSMVEFKHIKIDGDPKTENEMKSRLNDCLKISSNLDQTPSDFFHDLVYSMLDEGVVAIVPVDTLENPFVTDGFDVCSMRVGKITEWNASSVRIDCYNEVTGKIENIRMNKADVPIIENPFYAVCNAENSTLKRLMRKMEQLDRIDERIASKKLDIIMQLPYAVKTDQRKEEAERRIKSLSDQLANSDLGIGYIDATEKITQLNRPVESSLVQEISDLQTEFFNQLGLTKSVFDGTATEQELRSYYTRTIGAICERIRQAFVRCWLTKTARTQGQDIIYYMDPFKMVPISIIASLADTLRRNAIYSTNEIRKGMGAPRSDDPRADELFNPNIADKNQNVSGATSPLSIPGTELNNQASMKGEPNEN